MKIQYAKHCKAFRLPFLAFITHYSLSEFKEIVEFASKIDDIQILIDEAMLTISFKNESQLNWFILRWPERF